MINEWNKFKGWTVLEFFLINPNTKTHINELSRKLKIGTQTAQRFCNSYHNDGLLNITKIGNIHQFSLNENDARARMLKKFIGPYLVADMQFLVPFLEKNKNVLSISIYGSFSMGDYGDKSDLDILILTADESRLKTNDLSKIELKLGREIGITVMSLAKWRSLERKKDGFFLSIKKNNVLVWGQGI